MMAEMRAAAVDRITLLLPDLHPGGAERVVLDLAGHWAKEGRAIDLVCAGVTGRLREVVPDGVRLVDLGHPRVATSPVALSSYLRRNPERPCWSFLSHMNVALLTAGRVLHRHRGPLAVHEVSRFDAGRDPSSPVRRKAVNLGVRALYRQADIVAAVSDDIADDVARVAALSRATIEVIANPIDVARIARAAEADADHRWIGDTSAPVLLSVGRLAPEKDHETLLQAFALLLRDRALRLIVIGEGELDMALRQRAGELGIAHAVDFVGFQMNPWRLMARADLLVLSSFTEAFALVLAEAMACGTNVVSTDCGSGPRDILAHPAFGPLPPPRDPKALAAAIERRLHTPLHRDFLMDHARRFDIASRAQVFIERLAAAVHTSVRGSPRTEERL